jgi:hypothetical protein
LKITAYLFARVAQLNQNRILRDGRSPQIIPDVNERSERPCCQPLDTLGVAAGGSP